MVFPQTPRIDGRLKSRHTDMMRRDGVIKPYETEVERSIRDEQARRIVAEWQPERIASLKDRCKVPVTRIIALLGITQVAFSRLTSGDFTPSASLCLRMAHLEEMADSGELHGKAQYIPAQREMRRRMAHFRAWFFEKPATAEFPLVTVEVKVVFGRAPYQTIKLPVESFPKLRLKKFDSLVDVVKAVSTTIRKVAQANGRLFWTEIENEYWKRYAADTLPQEIIERSQYVKRAGAARRKKGE